MITKATADAWVDQAHSTQNHGSAAKLRLNGGAGSDQCQAFIWMPRPFPLGDAIHSATLRVYRAAAWAGTPTLNVRRLVDPWQEDRVTWDNRPSTSATNEVTTAAVGGAADGVIEIDVADILADVSGGSPCFGFRITISVDADFQLYAVENGVAELRPELEVEFSTAPQAPTPTGPIGGRAISVEAPRVSWAPDAEQTFSQVQVSDDEDDFSSPEYDSGQEANTDSSWDLDADGYSGAPSGDPRFWRVRIWDSVGEVSEYSDVQEFVYEPLGALEIISPAAPPGDDYREVVLADGPELYWALDDDTGFDDLTSNGHDGTGSGGITAGAHADSPIDGETASTDFDGTDDRVDESSYNTMQPLATFEGWAWADSATGVLIAPDAGSDTELHFDSGNVSFRISGTAATWAAAWPGTAQWVHWVLTMNQATDTAELYINGASQGTRSQTAAWPSFTQSRIGHSGFVAWLDGKLAHVAIYDRILTAIEIAEHYDVGVNGPDPGLGDRVVEETTPTVDWTFADQESAEVELEIVNDKGLWTSLALHPRTVSTETSVTLPAEKIRYVDQAYRVRVRGWDDLDRQALAGAPDYAEDVVVFTFVPGGPDPVDDLTAEVDGPRVDLVVERVGTPDYWGVKVDGVLVEDRLDPDDVFVSSGVWRIPYWGAIPRAESTYEVVPIVDDGGVLTHAIDNPTDDATTNPVGIWLVDADDSTALQIIGQDIFDAEIGASGATHYPEGSRRPVSTITGIRGYEGTISNGVLFTREDAATFLELKGRIKPLRLIVGHLNLEIELGVEGSASNPTPTPGDQVFEISFSWYQIDAEQSFEIVGG